jgi:hypothetical protein
MRGKIGDFVTATLKGKKSSIQGVFVKDNNDGTMIVQGRLGRYLCFGPRNVTVVPDGNLGDNRDFVYKLRRLLKEGTEGFPIAEFNFQVIDIGLSDEMLAEFYHKLKNVLNETVESYALLPGTTICRSNIHFHTGKIPNSLWQTIRNEKLKTGGIL